MNNQEIRDLINKMDISEKAAQCSQLTTLYFDNEGEITGPLQELNINEEDVYKVGSVIGVANIEDMNKIQKMYLEKSRLKIPLIFMADVIHGCNTIFPIPLGLASSFNPNLAYESSKVAARETKMEGIDVTFAPMSDLARDSRWGRVMETSGEDPYLASKFSEQYVKGFQQTNLTDKFSICACDKHFLGYSLSEAGREYNSVDLSRQKLYSEHLPAHKAAIDAGAQMVMTSFNTFEGISATANKFLLDELLRNQLGFDGMVISDWGAVLEMINHQIAQDEEECARKGIIAGCDMEMMTSTYIHSFEKVVDKNPELIEKIDEMVFNILKLKSDMGLFENPYKSFSEEELAFNYSKESLEIAKKCSDESIVLLKNNKVLPIDQIKVGFAGDKVNSNDLLGGWSWHGTNCKTPTLLDVLKANDTEYIYEENSINFATNFKHVETVIYFTGESSFESGEAKSKTNIKLKKEQINEIKLLNSLNKKVVLILTTGRALDLTDIEKDIDGLLVAFFPGSMGAQSIFDILYGKVNPSAKLPISFPRSVGQMPLYYNSYNTGRPLNLASDGYVSYYIDCPNSPLYSFGEGLTYSECKLNVIKVDEVINDEKELNIVVELRNDSELTCKEVVQVYIRDLSADVSRPIKELKKFEKVEVNAKDSVRLELCLNIEDLKYYNNELEYKADLGKFEVYIGTHFSKLEKFKFEYK